MHCSYFGCFKLLVSMFSFLVSVYLKNKSLTSLIISSWVAVIAGRA